MLSERIKLVRKSLKCETQKDFSELVNFPFSRVQDIERGKVKELKASELETLQENFLINSWWLLTGKGEMFISNDTTKNSDNYFIDLLNVRAGAGEGIYNYVIETVDTISLDKSFFRTPINTNKIKGIQVDGDSMEPTLRDGDYVLIDENINFGTNGIYAIQYGGQILIKRLQFKMDGTILIISDNDKYDKEEFNPKENQLPFQVLGIKILSIQK
ncbi:S24 family peptidase [Aliarcobacter cryaerophilus]|uniref:LexA family transcriptional regulator n=2 Tax=unclassified Arcobacter TaxID=2593671 RepID=A0AA96HYJ3_9BACT|nr:LexA family transcriptional regulator [Arcobacter sp. AZ-2023]WPD10374.1 LexA family transcriptional regulator [Arcobacter sp. DSM 115954]WNL15204.1 LexA family transcriptional regulator [Arcobacter sp. AZ-2023]WNL18914.1 LexA family transcriptional regulator [Arcobacter sp. AZ-2023]WNL21053.1 LexA family transcriptional regulator [Arcobacter sp. AZ-2023]